MGQAPSGDTYNEDGVGMPLIAGAGDFNGIGIVAKKYTTKPTKLVGRGEIILSIRASIGAHVRTDREYCLGRGVAAIVPDESRLLGGYLWHWVESSRGELSAKGRGATFLQVSKADIAEMSIPLPPLPEQRRIADILDRADDLRTQRRRAIALAEEALGGAFTDWFGRIRTQESNGLLEVVDARSGGTPSKQNPLFWGGVVPWFSPKDMKHPDLWDSEDHVTEAAISDSTLKLLPSDTVAVVVRGMILAHTFPVACLRVPSTINQDMKALVPRRNLDSQFLAHAIRAQSRAVLQRVSAAGHGTKRLDAEGLASIRIPEVSFERQSAFGRHVTRLQTIRDESKNHLAKLDELFASLQHRAFRGEL